MIIFFLLVLLGSNKTSKNAGSVDARIRCLSLFDLKRYFRVEFRLCVIYVKNPIRPYIPIQNINLSIYTYVISMAVRITPIAQIKGE
jgi:hypothetical protein